MAKAKTKPPKAGSPAPGEAPSTLPVLAKSRQEKIELKKSPSPAKRLFAKRPAERLERLQAAIRQVQVGRRESPRTARLLGAGVPKLAQKVVEEAAEVAIEAVRGDRSALVNESVDLLYNLTALLTGLDIDLAVVWAEMDRRETNLGMAEKLPKADEV